MGLRKKSKTITAARVHRSDCRAVEEIRFGGGPKGGGNRASRELARS